jgi:hypothetical protein
MAIPSNNIKFNYLYRDGSNYKNYTGIVFGNPNNLSLNQIEKIIKENLIDGEYFYTKKWDLPELFFEVSNSDDHEFHEFESIEYTEEKQHLKTTEEFLSSFKT